MLTMPAVSHETDCFSVCAIGAEALVKSYGKLEAVRAVSFTVAGVKSTTRNMLCTLERHTASTAGSSASCR